jgi:hypothetical protein
VPRNRVTFYPDDGQGFLGASNLNIFSTVPLVPGVIEKPQDLNQVSTFVWDTGTDQYWGDSVTIILDGQIMREGTDFTLSPGGAAFSIQTINTGASDWTGRWAAILGTRL